MPRSAKAGRDQRRSEEPRFALPVSVMVLAYNHADYLAKAIESALAQKTSFLYEIVIGVDHSSDRSVEIAHAFQQAYPQSIRVLAHQQRLGVCVNFLTTYGACRGECIAILEGDDYWTSRHKLERQYDLMRSRPEVSASFHNVTLLQFGQPQEFQNCPYPQPHFSLRDFLSENVICNCSTVMFRNGRIAFPEWFHQSRYYDWPLHVLNAELGPIAYIPEVMSAYRVHSASAWHGADRIERTQAVIWLLERFRERYEGRFNSECAAALLNWRCELERAHQAVARPQSRRIASKAVRIVRRLRDLISAA